MADEKQEIGAFRRSVPQASKWRTILQLKLRFKWIMNWNLCSFWRRRLPIDCDSITDRRDWSIKSRRNAACVSSSNFMVMWVFSQLWETLLNFWLKLMKFAASFAHIAHPIGSLVSGPICDRIGRRRAIMLVTVPLIVAWIVLGYSQSFLTVCFGILILGFCFGLKESPSVTYVCEIR